MNHFDRITIEFVDTDSISIYSFLFEIFNANSLKIFIFAMQNAIHIRPNQLNGMSFQNYKFEWRKSGICCMLSTYVLIKHNFAFIQSSMFVYLLLYTIQLYKINRCANIHADSDNRTHLDCFSSVFIFRCISHRPKVLLIHKFKIQLFK